MGRLMRLRLLLVVAAIPLVLWGALPLASSGATTATIASLDSKIKEKQRLIEIKRGKARVLSSDIARYSGHIQSLQGDITTLQARQSRIEADLGAKRAKLTQTQADLRTERARLARLRAKLAEDRRVLSNRLVDLYKADKPDVVTVVLEARGFADLLERTDFLQRVSHQDTRIVTRVRAARADADASAKRLDSLERTQAQITAVVLERRDQVAAVKGQLVDRRDGFATARAKRNVVLAAVHSDISSAKEDVAAMQASQARIASALAGPGAPVAGPIRQGSGQWVWPVNGPITSPFCERRSYEACHPGMDIGVPMGTPIRAADSGTVRIAGWVGGYGNYTCIAHSASLSSCYGHQSRIGVSVGQSVSKGQVIGAVGSTGHSTGPHLHFEARINGSVVNPMNYL